MAKKNNATLSLLTKLIISFLLLIGVSTAWFVLTKSNKVESLSLDVAKTTSVSVKSSDGQWSKKLEITHESLATVPITEYTGNGKQLYAPIALNKQVISFYEVDEASENNGYIDFTLQFKADGPVDIYLAGGSELLAESFEENLNGNGVSKNYIVGAARLAMWCVEDDNEPLIWVPNSRYQYNTSTKDVNTNGTVESKYSYAVDTTVENMHTVTTGGVANGIADGGNYIWGDISALDLANVSPVMTLEPEVGTELSKTLKVRVWIEGTDREAVKDFIGGRFKIKLNFTAIDKEGGEME